MLETHEYQGLWWIPADDSMKLNGKLTIRGGAAELGVVGSFGREVLSTSETEVEMSPFPAGQPRILGIATTGEVFTLERCLSGTSRQSFPGIETAVYLPAVVLVGAAFGEDEEITFDEIAMRTSELDTWAFVSGFTHSVTGDTEEETGHFIPTALDIHFEPPEAISIPLDNGAEARVEFRFEQSGMTWVTTQMRLSQSASLHLRYATPARLEELTTSVTQLRNLLSLAIGRPLSLLSVKGFRDDLVLQNSTTRKPVEIYWQVPHNPEPSGRPLLPQEMLFTLPEATPSISDVMDGWFEHQSVLRPFFNLYFGTLYHPDLFLDQRFLGYIRAVETYDRLRRDTTERPRAEHKTLLKTLAAAVPEEHRSWLKSKLAWSNELTLKRRLVDVLAECPNVASRLIGSDDQIDAFARMAVDTRNYHTHYDPALEARAAKGAELYQLTVQLRGIIEMSLLRELGFPCDAIDAILERVRRYQEVEHFRAIASAARASRAAAAGASGEAPSAPAAKD